MEAELIQALQPLTPVAMFLFIAPIITLFVLALHFQLRRRLPLPPGPKGLPMIGNMLTTPVTDLTHQGLTKLAKEYGGIFHLRMGFQHVIVVSSPEMARQVLQVHDDVFSNRPANIATSYLTYDRADLVFANYGPFWRQMRKLCVMKLFSRRRAESWDSVREQVDSVVRMVSANTGSAVNVGELIFCLTTGIIYKAAFGTSAMEGQEEFVQILQEFSKLYGVFNIADFIPWLRWIDPQRLNGRLAKARRSLDCFIDKIIDDHMLKKEDDRVNVHGGEADHRDMVDSLLAFYSREGINNAKRVKDYSVDDLQNSIKLTKDNIKAIIMDVMFGGTETVASVIEWTISELMRSPDELKKVQQELTDIVGLDRRLEEADFEKLTYLRCVIKEALRLHPPIPLLPHETSDDSEVGGFFIPKKSRVMINVWAIGRDDDFWDEAERFKPSRFLKHGVSDFKGSNFEYIPFGSGRRSCPGMQLGLFTVEMAVGHLLHCFRWELPQGMEPSELDMNDTFGLTAPRASRLVAVPTKRVFCRL
ncbi:hypothetical protein FEM48_Zijuj03G0015500 [Ziziphus jujuba var. spinosa]|uniref:Cytochrome P450 84A1-like n=1 Tax=Ziziphus jujuba var. spinosa TaxID=714518 RepID=A0A978VMD8_ZIZJJ|nr:hypothetical protein FEM48_Zijuj03G0015500 [Ziziphus jujuba var. spinosa]